MIHPRKLTAVIIVAVMLFSVISSALAAAGDLDTTFNTTGYRVTFTASAQEFMAVAQQVDGQLVAVGYDTVAGQDFAVVRYTAAGVPDAGFGTGGKVITSFGAGSDVANAVAIQSDGKIVVAGTATYGANTVFAVARYLSPTGTLDPAFGAGGVVTTSITGVDAAHAVAIQSDGKIVVAGEANAQFAVARYTTGGVLDTTFSGDGLVTTTIVGANNVAHAVLIQPADQKIIAVGQADQGSSDEFALARYTTTGALDTTFNGTGTVFTDLLGTATNDIGLAAALQSDGKIVVAGSINTGVVDYAVARYTTTGALDTSFSTDGVVTADFAAGADEPFGVAVQTTGKIVVVGTTDQGATLRTDFGLVRYTTSGALDATFGTGGKVATNLPPNAVDLGWGMTVQPDNKIVVVGSSDDGGSTGVDFAILRYQSPNALPTVSAVPKSGLEDQITTFAASDFTAHFSDADGDSLSKIKITSLPANGTVLLSSVAVTINQEISVANLGNLTFAPTSNFNGATSFAWNGSDGIDYATTGANVNLTLTAVNDVPSFSHTTAPAVLEDSGAATVTTFASPISPGPADEAGQVMTFTLTNNNNALFAVQPAINATTGNLTYTPAANANGSATITATLQDSGGTANGGVNTSAPQTFTINVTAVNDAPSFTKGANQTVLEDAGSQSVAGWATGISSGPSDEVAQSVTFSVTNNNAALFSVAPAISPIGTLTFTPAPNINGTATVTVTLSDNGGTVGGGSDTSAAQTFTINVTAVNDAPSFTKGANQTVLEDAGSQSVAGWATGMSSGPSDEVAQSMTFSVTNNNAALFSVAPAISPIGTLTFTPAPNATGTATVTVTLSDNGGTANGGADTSAAQVFTISVTAVNDAPSFTKGANQTVFEDAGLISVAGWATAISAGPSDESGQTLTFSLTNTNAALFSVQPAVNSAGTLTFTPAPNAFGSATITITLQDNGGTANGGNNTSAAQTFAITVTGINDAPSFTGGADVNVNEDAGAHVALNWATNISPGPFESTQVVTFSVINTNNSLFAVQPAVSPTGTLTFQPAAEAYGVASVMVFLRDSGGTANGGVDSSLPASFVITVTSVNDAPTFTKGTDITVLEDSGTSTTAGWATAMLPGPTNEATQTLTFAATAGNPALFSVAPAINATTGQLTFTPAANAFGSTTVTVTLKDSGGTANGGVDTSAPQTFLITIDPVNDAPSFAKGVDQIVLEDAGAQSISNWATAISAGPANESSQALTFTLTTDNAALFASAPAVNSVGTLSFTSAPNVYGSATVTVTLADSGGTANGGVNTSASQTFQITSVPVNDAPSFAAGADQAVNEDAAAQAVVGWATSISSGPNEPGQVLTFTATAGNPLLFSVQPAVAANGDLSYTPAANAYGSTTVTVTLQDDGGTANSGSDTSAPQTFVVTLNPVNDVPSFTSGGDRAVNEDAGAQTMSAWATAISAGPSNEASQALTFTLTTDNAALFGTLPAVNATTGNLTFTPATNQFGTATVTATLQDSGGTDRGGVDTSGTQVFTITVNSVNDAPSFGKGPNLNIITSTLQTFNGWATTIKPGPTNENGQAVDFIVTTNNAALFEIPPAISPLGTLTFKPTPHFNGSALVTVMLHDDGGTANGGVDTSAAQTFTIDVSASPDAPINIVPGQQETNLNTALFFSTSTGNHLAVYDDDAIQFNEQMSLTLSVGNGTLTLASTTGLTLTTGSSGAIVQFTGSITDVNANLNDLRFDPTPGFFGLTTLIMTTEDLGHPGELETFSDSDPVNIRVNAPPVAVDDAYNGPQGSALIVPVATGVLANDVALNARPITATLLNGPASGQLVLAADGSFVYIPTPTFSGIVTFTYQANDRGLISNAALVTISVMFINQAPTFNLGFNPAVNEDSGAQTVLNFMTNVTPGPSNETGQSLTLTVTAATPALFAAQPALDMGAGTLTYTPAANAFGSTSVTVTLQDNGGTANGGIDVTTKVFTITLNAVNDVPAFAKGADQTVRIDSGPQLVAGWASGISTGPANESAQTLTFNVTTSNNALFAILPSIDPTSGDLSFTSAPSIYGSATVTVTLQDNGGTANGGVDTSAPQAFVIVVQPYQLFLPLISRN